jgi:hypothetical protein
MHTLRATDDPAASDSVGSRALAPASLVREVLESGMVEVGVPSARIQEECDFIIGYLAERSGVLLPGGEPGGQEQYGFSHLSLQEYFVALHLASQITDPDFGHPGSLTWQELEPLTANPSWHEPLLLLFEILPGRWPTRALEELFPVAESEPSGQMPRWTRYTLLANVTMDSAIRVPQEKRESRLEIVWMALLATPNDFESEMLRGPIVRRLWSPRHGSREVFQRVAEGCDDISLPQLPELNLEALSRLPNLTWLSVRRSDVVALTGLDPRRERSLQGLDLSGTRVADLSPLSGHGELQYLDVSDTQVTDIRQLQSLSQLYLLDISGTDISDVSSLSSLRHLEHLSIGRTNVTDMSPLRHLRALKRVNIAKTRVMDIGPLATCEALETLDMYETMVESLAPLARLRSLSQLFLWSTQVDDLRPLAKLTALKELDASYTTVSDLSPLVGLKNLSELDVAHTFVSDLRPLSKLKALSSLNIAGTEVTDVTPLRELPNLNDLRVDASVDLSVFRDRPNIRIQILG